MLKHLAYKIGSDREIQAEGAATPGNIIKALLRKDVPLDDNKYAYIYGTGDRYPEIKEDIKGFDYTDYLNKYGYTGVKNVYGVINPNNEYHIDKEYEPLAKELAKHRYHFYDNSDDMFLDYDPDVLGYKDDVANFIHQMDLDEKGNVVIHDSDVYDFNPADYMYSKRVSKPLMRAEAKLMDKIGTPYILRQEGQPLIFDGTTRGSANIQDHLNMLDENDIARITGSGVIEPAFVEAEHPDPDYDPYDFANGGFLGLFKKNVDSEQSEAPSEPVRGQYLPKEYQKFYSNYSSYEDYAKKAKIPEDRAGEAEAMAQYYYNNDPTYEAYYRLVSGPFKTYQDLRDQYTRSKDYMVDMTKGNTYRLKSLDANGKPTNKHTMKVNEGLLDYIYDQAVKGGVDPKAAIALATNESNLGNSRVKDGKVGLFDLFSYWAGTGAVIYPNAKVVDPFNNISKRVTNGEKLTVADKKKLEELYTLYGKMAKSIHPYEGNNVVADAVKYFNAGKYPGNAAPQERIDAYNKLVMSRFDELMNDPRFQTWWAGKKHASGGKIHIKPENRGKFTALKKRTGKSASWFKAHGTPAQKKMATFALNSRKWHHKENGGLLTNIDSFSF